MEFGEGVWCWTVGRPEDVGLDYTDSLLLLPPATKSHCPWAHMTRAHKNRQRGLADKIRIWHQTQEGKPSNFSFCFFALNPISKWALEGKDRLMSARKDPHGTLWICSAPSWREQERGNLFRFPTTFQVSTAGLKQVYIFTFFFWVHVRARVKKRDQTRQCLLWKNNSSVLCFHTCWMNWVKANI